MNEGQILERANKAKGVLENPMYAESFEMVHKAILKQIEDCPLGDVATAEALRKCLRLLRDVKANLDVALQQGKVVSFRIEQERAKEERIRKFRLLPGFFQPHR